MRRVEQSKAKPEVKASFAESVDLDADWTGYTVSVNGLTCMVVQDMVDTIQVTSEDGTFSAEINKSEAEDIKPGAEVVITDPVKVGDVLLEPGDQVVVTSEATARKLRRLRKGEAVDLSADWTGYTAFYNGLSGTITDGKGATVSMAFDDGTSLDGVQKELLSGVTSVVEVKVTEPVEIGNVLAQPGDVLQVTSEAVAKAKTIQERKAKLAARRASK